MNQLYACTLPNFIHFFVVWLSFLSVSVWFLHKNSILCLADVNSHVSYAGADITLALYLPDVSRNSYVCFFSIHGAFCPNVCEMMTQSQLCVWILCFHFLDPCIVRLEKLKNCGTVELFNLILFVQFYQQWILRQI